MVYWPHFLRCVGLLVCTMVSLSCTRHSVPKKEAETKMVESTVIAEPARRDPLFFIEGQLCQHLREIFQDSKGNLWFGTNVYDLMRYDGDSLVYITKNQGFSGGRVTGIMEYPQGTMRFATALGLNSFDGKAFSLINHEAGLMNDELWCLAINQAGEFWMGHNLGFSRYNGVFLEQSAVPVSDRPGTPYMFYPGRVTEMLEDSLEQMWMGTDGYGVLCHNTKGIRFLTTEDGLPDNCITTMLFDRQGHLWIGTAFGGLSRFDGKNFTNYTQQGILEGVEISALYEDKNGDIWIGIENNGVYRYDGEIFHHYGPEDLHGGSILCFYRDRQDRFWLGGWGGLFRFMDGRFVPVTKAGPWEVQ